MAKIALKGLRGSQLKRHRENSTCPLDKLVCKGAWIVESKRSQFFLKNKAKASSPVEIVPGKEMLLFAHIYTLMVSGIIFVSTDCNILTDSQKYSKVLTRRILLAHTNENYACYHSSFPELQPIRDWLLTQVPPLYSPANAYFVDVVSLCSEHALSWVPYALR